MDTTVDVVVELRIVLPITMTGNSLYLVGFAYTEHEVVTTVIEPISVVIVAVCNNSNKVGSSDNIKCDLGANFDIDSVETEQILNPEAMIAVKST